MPWSQAPEPGCRLHPGVQLCTGEGTHADHLQHWAGGLQGAKQRRKPQGLEAGAVSCSGGEQGSGPWTSGVQASSGHCSVPPCGVGSQGRVWHRGQPRKGSASGAKGTGPSRYCSPLNGTGPRPPTSPALRVTASDSVDRFVCCLLIHSDSFTVTAGWVPAGRPQAHLPPDSQLGAEVLTARQAQAWRLPTLFQGAGWGSLGGRRGLAAPGP